MEKSSAIGVAFFFRGHNTRTRFFQKKDAPRGLPKGRPHGASMMCERRDQTQFSERDATRTNSQARDPIGQRALYAELGYRRKPRTGSIWPRPIP